MKFESELKIIINKKETLIDKYINSFFAGNIKNLTIKEDYIMLERLKERREVYVAELERIKTTTDLEAIKNARFEIVKEQIEREVIDEFNSKLSDVENKIKNYDFVINELEMTSTDEVDEVIVEE